MAISLYAAMVPSMLQILSSTAGLIGKAEAFCVDREVDGRELLDARLAEDMLPFAYQVKSVAVHSLGAIEGVRRGQFSPDLSEPPTSFDGLQARIDDARAGVEAVTAAELEGFIGRDMAFVVGDHRMDFTAEEFLLSFSQPNFYFHAATAYAILRGRGVPIGKRDFLGRIRRKP